MLGYCIAHYYFRTAAPKQFISPRLLWWTGIDTIMSSFFPSKENATTWDAWPPHNTQINYDWTKPTVQIYQANDEESADEPLPDTFLRERQKLDYNYHNRLICSRLIFQDSVIAQIRSGKTTKTKTAASPRIQHDDTKEEEREEDYRPWLIFTAGPMGVGKGYVLAQLKQMHVLDASDYIKIDPDMIKTELPEMGGYEYASAATLLHAESSQMADVLLEHCLANSYDMIVDGSLRDVTYYQQLMQRIRREFPTYRIAILHVTAHPNTIRDRAKKRAGRAVPEALVEESIRQVPESVSALTAFVDAVHVIRNESGSKLKLEKSIRRVVVVDDNDPPIMLETKDPSWEMFGMSWKANSKRRKNEEPLVLNHQLDIKMDDAFECAEVHELANAIWKDAYPNFCARCTVCSDRQCGVCRHGRHRCGCHECASMHS